MKGFVVGTQIPAWFAKAEKDKSHAWDDYQSDEIVSLMVRVPESTRTFLRLMKLAEGKSMSALINECIDEYVKNHGFNVNELMAQVAGSTPGSSEGSTTDHPASSDDSRPEFEQPPLDDMPDGGSDELDVWNGDEEVDELDVSDE